MDSGIDLERKSELDSEPDLELPFPPWPLLFDDFDFLEYPLDDFFPQISPPSFDRRRRSILLLPFPPRYRVRAVARISPPSPSRAPASVPLDRRCAGVSEVDDTARDRIRQTAAAAVWCIGGAIRFENRGDGGYLGGE